MQVSRFELDPDRAADRRQDDAEPGTTLQASGDGDDEDQRRDETIEEPGYGHGV